MKPRYCCNGRLRRISTIVIGKAPHLNLLQCHSVLTFRREVFQAKLLAVGIPPTGEEADSVAPVDLSFGTTLTSLQRVIQVIGKIALHRLQWRHNHDFWFSDVRYQFLRPRQHIEERLTLIHQFLPSSTPAFLAAKRLISEPISQYRCSR